MKITATACFDADAVKKKAYQQILAKGKEKVQHLRCPEHGGSVTVTLEGSSLVLSGFCCDKLKEDATSAIRN